MKKSKIYIDLDNVISDSDAVVRSLIKKYVDIDAKRGDINRFDYWKALGYGKDKEVRIWKEFHGSAAKSATQYKFAKDALIRLNLFCDIQILTARPIDSKNLTVRWLKKNGIPYSRLLFVNEDDKVDLVTKNGLALIEDKGETALKIAQKGCAAILMDRPWNSTFKHPNLIRKRDWSFIYKYICTLKPYSESLYGLHKVLNDMAIKAQKNSYSPYSNFPVGAALMLLNGKIMQGCNIENIAYGPTICAERTAIFKAISDGYRKGELFALSIATPKSKNGNDPGSPCGVCRQVMAEFSDEKFPLQISINNGGENLIIRNLDKYLPHPFTNF